MPKHQPQYKYVTQRQSGGATFREIAEVIRDEYGNASTAGVRHIYHQGLRKLATHIMKYYNIEITKEKLDAVIRSEDFQNLIRDAMEGNMQGANDPWT